MTSKKAQAAQPAKTYRHYDSYDFTARDLGVIDALFQEWRRCEERPSSRLRRHISPEVMRYATEWGLLVSRRHNGRTYLNYGRAHAGLYRPANTTWEFVPRRHLPVEVLWSNFRTMLGEDGTAGFSLTKHDGWLVLNIYPAGHRFHSDRDVDAQVATLMRLDSAHYIKWEALGEVWNITTLPEEGRLAG